MVFLFPNSISIPKWSIPTKMEMKKLMLFGSDMMDKVVHQLNTAFGVDG